MVRAPACHAGGREFKSRLSRFFLVVFFCTACSPSSGEEWKLEGESISKKLVVELEQVESLQDLELRSSKIKKYFYKLTDLAVAAKQYQIRHPDAFEEESYSMHISDILKSELMRIYQIEGASEIIENLQRESLHKLDQYSKKIQNREKL